MRIYFFSLKNFRRLFLLLVGRNLQHLLKGIERRRREKKGKEKVTNQNFIKIQIKIYFIFHILFSCSFIFNFLIPLIN